MYFDLKINISFHATVLIRFFDVKSERILWQKTGIKLNQLIRAFKFNLQKLKFIFQTIEILLIIAYFSWRPYKKFWSEKYYKRNDNIKMKLSTKAYTKQTSLKKDVDLIFRTN